MRAENVGGCCLWALSPSLVGVLPRSAPVGGEVVPLSSSAALARPLLVRVRSRRGLLSAGRAKCGRITLVIMLYQNDIIMISK